MTDPNPEMAERPVRAADCGLTWENHYGRCHGCARCEGTDE